MNVDQILSLKGRNVVSIDASQSLGDAARLLSERRIGAVVVLDGRQPVAGILSERDIVKAVATQGARALDEPVSRFMTTEVITCTGRSSVNELMELMTQRKFRHVPVVEGGQITGIISIGDVVKQRVEEVEAESRAIKDYIATA